MKKTSVEKSLLAAGVKHLKVFGRHQSKGRWDMKNDKTGQTGLCRALIAKGPEKSACVILATDNRQLAEDLNNTSTYVGDLLGYDFVPDEPGLYLFEGEGTWVIYGGLDEPDLEWAGKIRRVTSDEYEGLLAMSPPEPEEAA